MRWKPAERSLVSRMVNPPLSEASTSAPSASQKSSVSAKPTSISGRAAPNCAVISNGMPLRPSAFTK